MITTVDAPRGAPGPASDLNRRRLLRGGAALAGLLATGCSRGSGDTPEGRASGGYPRTVGHVGGEVTLPARPQRVATNASYYELDALLALGVMPVLRGSYGGDDLRSWQLTAGATEVPAFDRTGGVNLEALAAADVDLVLMDELSYGGDTSQADEFARLAPVLVLPSGRFDEQLRTVALALDIDDARLREATRRVDDAFAAFRAPRIPRDITAFDYDGSGQLTVWTADGALSSLLQRVGLPALTSPSAPADQVRKDYTTVSLEQMGALDADLVISYSDDASYRVLSQEPLFRRLSAVREGRFFRTTLDEYSALHGPGPLSIPLVVDTLQRALA